LGYAVGYAIQSWMYWLVGRGVLLEGVRVSSGMQFHYVLCGLFGRNVIRERFLDVLAFVVYVLYTVFLLIKFYYLYIYSYRY
jgi:hypothetical protein